MIAVILFASKQMQLMFDNKKILWKSYTRMILSYSLAIYFIKSNRKNVAGLLVIIDALIAVQARHTASALSFAIQKNMQRTL